MKKYYKGRYGEDETNDLWDEYQENEEGFLGIRTYDGPKDGLEKQGSSEDNKKDNYDSNGILYPIEEPIFHPVTGELLKHTKDKEEIKRIFAMRKSQDPAERELGELLVFVQVRNVIWSVMQSCYPSFFLVKDRSDCKEYRYDLFMQGYEGVMMQIDEYDPERSLPNTYFYPHIQHQMGEYINKYIKQSSAYTNSKMKLIHNAEQRLREQGQTNITIMDIAYETGLKPATVRKLIERNSFSQTVSLDHILNAKESPSAFAAQRDLQYDDIETNTDYGNPYNIVAEKEEYATLYSALDNLPLLYRQIITMKNGIGCDRHTYQEIFEKTGIPTDRVKHIEIQAQNKLRADPTLRTLYRGGRSKRIQMELDFESITITPDKAAQDMMLAIEMYDDATMEECFA